MYRDKSDSVSHGDNDDVGTNWFNFLQHLFMMSSVMWTSVATTYVMADVQYI